MTSFVSPYRGVRLTLRPHRRLVSMQLNEASPMTPALQAPPHPPWPSLGIVALYDCDLAAVSYIGVCRLAASQSDAEVARHP